MNEIILNHRELKELLEIVETINPPNTMMLMAGRVTVTADNSSGISCTARRSLGRVDHKHN